MPVPEPNPVSSPSPEQVAIARRHVRRFRRGVVRAGDEVFACSFVIDGRDGALVLPTPDAIFETEDLVLYVPNDGFHEMALLVSAEPLESAFDEACDRHLAYHGRAEEIRWARCRVDSAKWGGRVYEGAALLGPNPIASIEPKLCKRVNEDRERLAALTELLTRVRPESPLCVGVDHLGMDVRTRVGVIRVEWPREIGGPDEAVPVIAALLGGAA